MKKRIAIACAAMLSSLTMFTMPVQAATNVFVLSDGTVYDASTSQNVVITGVNQNSTAGYNLATTGTTATVGNKNVVILSDSNNNGTITSVTTNIAPDPVKTKYDITIMPNGVIFDGGYYAANNPDVVQALGTSHKALLNHYYQYGMAEGRLPNAGFTNSKTNILKYQVNGVTFTYAPTDATYFTQGRIDAIGQALKTYYGK